MSSSGVPKERSRQRLQNPLEAWRMQNEVFTHDTSLEMDEKKALLNDNGLYKSNHNIVLKNDLSNILLLLFLYVLQGIPLGVAGSIPLILRSKNVSYSDQAIYSFVFWPFSLKLLWAPLVDAAYFSRFGRRKSWLVPTQYFLGLFMFFLSYEVDELLKSNEHTSPNIIKLTAVFFMFGFLAATQDIAVDGWALTMLSKENVGLASTCNSVGQTAGYFLGNILFLALESAEFCNKYLRTQSQPTGIVTLADFLFFWGIVFVVTTTLVMVLKKENSGQAGLHQAAQQGIKETYKSLICIIRMPAILNFCFLLLTSKIGFSAADEVTGLKLIEMGVPKEQLAILAVPMVPLQILLPIAISKYTAGHKPLNIFYWAMPFRLTMGIIFALLVFWTPMVKQGTEFPTYYYGALLFSYALHQVAVYSMYVAVMAFNAKISDPSIGGTYMTLLNTISNLAGNWPATLALWLVDPLTVKKCIGAPEQSCRSAIDSELCVKSGGSCSTVLDGYYVESVFCILFGFAWWLCNGKKFRNLQDEHPSTWQCKRNN
ncbi:acetyl-coenzyme A transporter 1 [Amblyraja radiata]|uniref:acetyl-coenzyme A transporter 1 n=1 Tax=Amblyraja radiata TaxID=386614 RepID=UPI0014021E33|nr:acetyl-coenzyme A transporter 1 [Amblyraja radiata]XP_032887127.1 acetyl-coenzyme A transporter 1 [Amblyraja radiata]XP_032887129.1 acetyl-coenzyme A transporter 1 [Amblyraja radiata]XP_032887130.1 acetyl-coenzyme A transporter 1 [Amblyraja radiata]XP_032887131.1 acetyl-coenzyme A transporter 1 [Amblyraja radiata]XP_032887132.1 acetyl-coenzyme A transporter 1 [Amblyraja radiata]XP_032887133.1 acetyl-coenzyme A transporter 1 [Amblyraja radiata]XP_032887134.1 acetyl-coenzyme A transporter 1